MKKFIKKYIKFIPVILILAFTYMVCGRIQITNAWETSDGVTYDSIYKNGTSDGIVAAGNYWDPSGDKEFVSISASTVRTLIISKRSVEDSNGNRSYMSYRASISYDYKQSDCWAHNNGGTANAFVQHIEGVYTSYYNSSEGYFEIKSVSDSNTSGKTTSAYGNTSVGYLLAQMEQTQNSEGVRKALYDCYQANEVVVSSAISNSSSIENRWENISTSTAYTEFLKLRSVSASATQAETGKTVTDSSSVKYTIIGPFKMNYGYTGISKIEVAQNSSTTTTTIWNSSTKHAYWCTSASTTWSNWSNNFNATLNGKYKLINQEFYLAVKTADLPSDGSYTIKITQSTFEYNISRAITTYDYGYQEYGLYSWWRDDSCKAYGTASWTITADRDKSLILTKYDINGKANDYTSSSEANGLTGNLTGAKFIIYAYNTSDGSGWLNGGANNEKTLKTSVSDATEYTLSNKTLEIKKLTDGYYYIYEVKAPTSSSYYPLYVQDRYMKVSGSGTYESDFQSNTRYSEWVYMGYVKLTSSGAEINSTSSYRQIISVSTSGSQTTVELGNYRAGILQITKSDSSSGDALSGAKFMIYCDATNNNNDGWLTGTYNKLKTYESFNYDNTSQKFNKNTLSYLAYGTYYIYEVVAPTKITNGSSVYYDLKNQSGYKQTTSNGTTLPGSGSLSNIDYVYCGSAVISKTNTRNDSTKSTKVTKNITNRLNGSLTLYKVDKDDTSTSLNGATFIIYCDASNSSNDGWLKGSATGNKSYVTYANKTKYTVKGTLTITKLVYGTYYIYETTAPSGYFLSNQSNYNKTGVCTDAESDLSGTDYVYCGSVTVSSSSLALTKTITNEFFANVTIYKRDSSKNTAIEGIGFKIKNNTNGKWLCWSSSGEATGSDREHTNEKIGQTSNESNASIFYTDSSGYIKITHIDVGGSQTVANRSFTVSEVDSKNLYYQTDTSVTKTFKITTKSQALFKVTLKNTKPYSLQLRKSDRSVGLSVSITAKFYIQYFCPTDETTSVEADNDGKWLTKNGTYSNKKSSISVSSTDYTTISGILRGTYVVYEYQTPTGYDITQQYCYNSSTGYVECGEIEVGDGTGSSTYKMESNSDTGSVISSTSSNGYKKPLMIIYNNKFVGSLTGVVWQDNASGKINTYDNLYYKAKDTELEGIKVTLYKKTSSGTDKIAETTTNSEGRYTFTKDTIYRKVSYWSLTNYYVSFEYDNEKYIVVDPFATGSNANANYNTNNSKAQEYQMTQDELADANLVSGGNLNPGYAVTIMDATSLTSTGCLANYYNNSNYTIENINLGLLLKEDPDFSVEETLAYAYITINGFTYIYYYDKPTGTVVYDSYSNVPNVAKQRDAHTYQTANQLSVYSSDIAATSDGTRDMKLYLVYSIYVYNAETFDDDDVYKEQKLYLSSLTNTYDYERLRLSKDNAGSSQYTGSDQFSMWTNTTVSTTSATASYSLFNNNTVNSNSVYKDGIDSEQTIKTYIQFEVTNTSLMELLKGDLSKNANAATTANATGFHEYLRTDNVWHDDLSAKEYASNTSRYPRKTAYASANTDGDVYYIHKSVEKSKNSGALYVAIIPVITLPEERTVSGIVYEDEAKESTYTYNGTDYTTYVGNGKLDSTEYNRAKNVKVELLEAGTSDTNGDGVIDTNDLQQATLYVRDTSSSSGYTKSAAETTTNDKGEYSFVGVTPGYYYIRYTYGDGTQKIVDTNGNVVDSLTSVDYKSTIINTNEAGSVLQNAMESSWPNYDVVTAQTSTKNDLKNYYSTGTTDENSMKLLEWYKYLSGGITFNTAVDNLSLKDLYNGYEYTEKGIYDSTGKLIVRYHYNDQEQIDYMYEVQYVDDGSGNSVEDESATSKVIGTFVYNTDGDLESIEYTGASTLYPLTIQSYTPETAISVENTELNYTNNGDQHVSTYDKFNFGIVKQPETGTEVTKSIEDVSLTVQQGSTAVSGLDSTYVTVFDAYQQYIGVEINEDTIYGSNLEVTYSITVQNESQADYIEEAEDDYGTYYKYGTITSSTVEKTIQVNEMIDDVDSKYTVSKLDGTTVQQTLTSGSRSTKCGSSVAITKLDATTDKTLGENSTTTTTSVIFTGWEEIKTGDSLTIEYTTDSLINASDDALYTNPARVTSISLKQLTTLTSSYVWGERSWTEISIYPSTGGDMRNILYITGAIALIIMACGVILIKKKIM